MDSIDMVYAKMEAEGWDTSAELKWIFFFISKKKENLEEIYNELKDYNYVKEEITLRDNEMWWLRAFKTEVLLPEKLRARNASFVQLAAQLGSVYDGWSVRKK